MILIEICNLNTVYSTLIVLNQMDLFFGIGNVFFGSLMVLIGFKVYNPFTGKNKTEEEKWTKKYGLFFKIGGIGMLAWGVFQIIRHL